MSSLPDSIEPLVGLRMWRTPLSDPPDQAILASPFAVERWTPGQALHAECRLDFEHPAPYAGCECGIYGLRAPNQQFFQTLLSPDIHIGEINLWGRVVESERGYRAELAYPRNLFLPLPVQEMIILEYARPALASDQLEKLLPALLEERSALVRALCRNYGIDAIEQSGDFMPAFKRFLEGNFGIQVRALLQNWSDRYCGGPGKEFVFRLPPSAKEMIIAFDDSSMVGYEEIGHHPGIVRAMAQRAGIEVIGTGRMTTVLDDSDHQSCFDLTLEFDGDDYVGRCRWLY